MIRIGTRGSKLALWQAHFLQRELEALGEASELVIIKTQGDRIQDIGFNKMEGKGFFTKELEDAQLDGRVDLAVHSMKDLPTTQPEGLVLAAVSYREDPTDTLLIRRDVLTPGATLQLPDGARVGTSSARRKSQMRALRPDVELLDLRGNVPTRVEKLRSGDYDAIILATAGLKRLGLAPADVEQIRFSPREFVPAPAQGVLAFQCREADTKLRRLLQRIHHRDVAERTNVERAVLRLLDGGCQLPLGVYCETDEQGNYHVWAAIAESADGSARRIRLSSSTRFELAEMVVDRLKVQA